MAVISSGTVRFKSIDADCRAVLRLRMTRHSPVTLKKRSLSYVFRVTVLLGAIYVLAISGLWSFGHLGGGKLMLLVFIVLTALFAETRYAYAAIAVSAISLIVFGWVFVSGSMNVNAATTDYH